MRFEELQAKRDAIYAVAQKYGVTNIRVFGSVARGDADALSDVDLLVDMPPQLGLFDVLRFRSEVADMLIRQVDVVESGARIHPDIWQRISHEARPL